MDRIEEISRSLQGSADPLVFVPEIQDLVRSQFDSLKSLQKMHQMGDNAGLASALKSYMAERAALLEASRESDVLRGFVSDADVALDTTVPDLQDMSDSQIVEFLPAPEIWNDVLDGMQLVIEGLEAAKTARSKSKERRLNGAFGGPFEFDSEPPHSHSSSNGGRQASFSPWAFMDQGLGKAARRAKGKYRGRLPNLSKILHPGDDEQSVRRRLDIKERHRRRLEALPVCQPTCTPGDGAYDSCNCNRLNSCITSMADYDIALLFVEGYIGTDPEKDEFARFTVEGGVNLFDADFDITGKINRIRQLATDAATNGYSSESCVALLLELHTACNPFADSCSGLNSRSYQLSVDDVCDAVDNPTKLLLTEMSQELDGYDSDDGNDSFTDACGVDRLAFATCEDFAKEFDRLYQGRDTALYPHPNPMRNDQLVAPEESYIINFPVKYNFEQTVHGIYDLQFVLPSAISKVQVVSNGWCLDSPAEDDSLHFAMCQDGNANQDFTYDASTLQIKKGNLCVDHNPGGNDVVYLSECHGKPNQKWLYVSHTKELKTFGSYKCLDWNDGGGGLRMWECNGSAVQQFTVPSEWLAGISTSAFDKILVKSYQNLDMCLDSPTGENLLHFAICQDGNTNQDFSYDPRSRRIKHGGDCVDYNPQTSKVYLGTCHDGLNQKWFYDVSSKRVKTLIDNKCLDWNDVDVDGLRMLTCNGNDNQQFILPQKWLPAVSSSTFEEVRVMHAPKMCLDASTSSNDDDKEIFMSDCDAELDSLNQVFHYDTETREIKRDGFCLDQNVENNNVYLHHECHGGLSQKWYFEENLLKNLNDNRCLDMWVESGTNQFNIYMEDCHGGDNQKFLVPSLWLPGIHMEDVRVFQDRTKCMGAHPDMNNNVYMADCQAGNPNQDFHYDPRTRHIKHGGLCLDYHTSNYNVYLAGCEYSGDRQKWQYNKDSNRLQTLESSSSNKCLDWNTIDNLYMADCHDEDNQKFIVPSQWLPSISILAGSTSDGLDLSKLPSTYSVRPVQKGVWENDVCTIDMMRGVMSTCDESMSLLLGNDASVGTLRDIANLVNNVGPDRMPGRCCLDSPTNSEWFGSSYDPNRGMSCQITGPWHLGISKKSCENASGRWHRSPCTTLMECINQRPSSGDEHYSQSFEDFASDIAISDPSDEEACQKAREKLGHESDYPFDTEVCDSFNGLLCDSFFVELDASQEGLGQPNTATPIEYVEPDWPEDAELPFDILPKHADFLDPDDSTAKSDQLNAMQNAVQTLESRLLVFERLKGAVEKSLDNTCDMVFDPVCAGIACINNPVTQVCHTVTEGISTIFFWLVSTTDIANRAVGWAYEKMTISPGAEYEMYDYFKYTFDNFKIFDDWNYNSLVAINKNIMAQHTAMRGNLQTRHEDMTNVINKWTTQAVNGIGCHIMIPLGAAACTDGGDSSVELNVQWLGSYQSLWEKLDSPIQPSTTPSFSGQPSTHPSVSSIPSFLPSLQPSASDWPTSLPSENPSISGQPLYIPSFQPSSAPSETPSSSNFPTAFPSRSPSNSNPPSRPPSASPTKSPSKSPTHSPSASPTNSGAPSIGPSKSPTNIPSASPRTAPPSIGPATAPRSSRSFELPFRRGLKIVSRTCITGSNLFSFRSRFQRRAQRLLCRLIPKCRVNITRFSCGRGRRLSSRNLQATEASLLIIEFTTSIVAYCENEGCSDVHNVAEAIKDQADAILKESLSIDSSNGNSVSSSFVEELNLALAEAVATDASIANLIDLSQVSISQDDIVAGYDIDPQEFANIINEVVEAAVTSVVAENSWYPDWLGLQNTCKNDGNYPTYMYINAGYFEKSLIACCERYFNWDFSECSGGTHEIPIGFYPNWGATEIKCLESSVAMPDYVRNNPNQWLHNDIESCCENHYNWEYNTCISGSGGTSSSLSGTGKWYVNHIEEICQQDCPNSGNVTCGGPANSWEQLFDSATDCCSSQLSWLAPNVCQSKSTVTTVVGSNNWYVDWGLEMCVKDCDDESDRYCGGFASKWDDLYRTSSECCGRLWYRAQSECIIHPESDMS